MEVGDIKLESDWWLRTMESKLQTDTIYYNNLGVFYYVIANYSYRLFHEKNKKTLLPL